MISDTSHSDLPYDLDLWQIGDMVFPAEDTTVDSDEDVSDTAVRLARAGKTECLLANHLAGFVYRSSKRASQELLNAFPDGVRRTVKKVDKHRRVGNPGFENMPEKYFELDVPFVLMDGSPADLEPQRYKDQYPRDRAIAYGKARFLAYEKEQKKTFWPSVTVIFVSQLDYGRTGRLYECRTYIDTLPDGREIRITVIFVNGEKADDTTSLGRLMIRLMKVGIEPKEFEPEFPEHAKALRKLNKKIKKKEEKLMSEYEKILTGYGDKREANGIAKGKAEGKAEFAEELFDRLVKAGVSDDILIPAYAEAIASIHASQIVASSFMF